MAGDWIAMRICLPDEPEVIAIASACGINEDETVGKLLRIWGWADTHTTDGNAVCNAGCNGPSITETWIDRYLRCAGFGAAMRNVGWLEVTSNGIRFPRFDRYNLQTGKQRVVTARRVKRHRDKCNADGNAACNAHTVTPTVTTPLTTEQYSTEERERARATPFVPPSVDDVRVYCAAQKLLRTDPEAFLDHYTANGWKVGRNPMRDWKATVRNWEKRQPEFSGQPRRDVSRDQSSLATVPVPSFEEVQRLCGGAR